MYSFFFFSSRRRHTRCSRDWSSDVCSSDLSAGLEADLRVRAVAEGLVGAAAAAAQVGGRHPRHHAPGDRKSTRLNSSHGYISYAVFCLKKKKNIQQQTRSHTI